MDGIGQQRTSPTSLEYSATEFLPATSLFAYYSAVGVVGIDESAMFYHNDSSRALRELRSDMTAADKPYIVALKMPRGAPLYSVPLDPYCSARLPKSREGVQILAQQLEALERPQAESMLPPTLLTWTEFFLFLPLEDGSEEVLVYSDAFTFFLERSLSRKEHDSDEIAQCLLEASIPASDWLSGMPSDFIDSLTRDAPSSYPLFFHELNPDEDVNDQSVRARIESSARNPEAR